MKSGRNTGFQKTDDHPHKEIIRKVIIDQPTGEDRFHGKGHERTAISLAKAIREFDGTDRAIGLDGPWGSGKSSVVEIAAKHLEQSRASKGVKHHFFTFDIWKSQGAGFRRSFLEHFVSWAKEEFPKQASPLADIEKDIRGKTQEIETNNHPILGWFGIFLLLSLPFMPIYYFWARAVFSEKDKDGNTIAFIGSNPFWVIVALTASIILAAAWKWWTSKDGMGFKSALSSIILIGSKQHQDHKVIQKIREVDPNDYEFHRTLRSILRTVQSPSSKVVLVLDNIDRLPTKEIKEYWALVRSIFSRANEHKKLDENETITAIVPYDRALIDGGVNSDSSGSENQGDTEKASTKKSQLTKLSSRELFSKTFDEILNVSPPVLSNAREFFIEKLEYALPGQVSTDDGFRTYRIFCELLRNEGGITTPRQVVSFINDLSGLYALHRGAFMLPTVAAYLAHHDLISADPNVLRDQTKLDPKVVALASNADLQRHLAAMVFNVDPELAFQILLDDVIAQAAVADEPGELVALSEASGFDLRVDDVVRSNMEEWRSTGSYRVVLRNFAFMLSSFNGDAKSHVISALVQGFEGLASFPLDKPEYSTYLKLFEIADESQKVPLVKTYLRSGFAGVEALQKLDFETGENFAEFLISTRTHLEELGLKDTFRAELKGFTPNANSDFLFGLAANIERAGLGFGDFKGVNLKLAEDDSFFTEIATDDPQSALVAFRQFKRARLIDNEQWIGVVNACLGALQSEVDDAERVASLLEIVIFGWKTVPSTERGSIALNEAISEGQFFRNIGPKDLDECDQSIANAFFFIGQSHLGKSLTTPTKKQPNGQRVSDTSDEFTEFNGLLAGDEALSARQAVLVAEKAVESQLIFNPWINFGAANRDHKAIQQVVKAIFAVVDYPINLPGLLSSYEYLTTVLEEAELVAAFARFGEKIRETDVAKSETNDIKIGLLSVLQQAGGGFCEKLHSHVDAKLRSIDEESWTAHLEALSHETMLLVEKLSTSGCKLESAKFREPLMKLILGVLQERLSPQADAGFIDKLTDALDRSYRDDICRTIREELKGVTPNSLRLATHLFPALLSDVIRLGERVKAVEKENVVRHILCPALEGRNRALLQVFVDLGRQRVSDFVKSCDDITKKLLEAAVGSFSSSDEKYDWIRTVTEVVMGRKRTRTFLEIVFGTSDDRDEDGA